MRQPELILPVDLAFMVAGADDQGNPKTSNMKAREIATSVGLRVLIVEDEGLIAINMESALAEAGFEVVGIVDTEADAVAEAESKRPDIVLMDITLREGNGIAAARQIQTKLKTQIVFVSGNSDPSTLAAVDTINPAGFIRKPFLTDRFVQQVKQAATPKN